MNKLQAAYTVLRNRPDSDITTAGEYLDMVAKCTNSPKDKIVDKVTDMVSRDWREGKISYKPKY